MATNIIDTHTHLCDSVFDADLDQVLERARASGVGSIILVGEDLQDAHRNLELAKQVPMLKPAAGLYPGILDRGQATALTDFIQENRKDLVAIGEVGLDHWIVKTSEEKALQQSIFRAFIHLSREVDLPLNVHSRSAGRKVVVDTIAAIKDVAPEEVIEAAAVNTIKLYGDRIRPFA